ncbi:hypothetical protein [Sphingomonas sp.]|uniref:hypothetical protein n=1 Tax=Sphingomonas sp. TaxID=28214 RepID=UPI00286E3209|nr:hypothetical protein [Sphingomonas sp.]
MPTHLPRRAMLAMIGSGAAAACAPLRLGRRELTLEEVIRRNTLARGGAAALDRVRALHIDVEIVEGGQTLNGHYAANAEGLVRIDVYAAGKLVGAEGVDSKGVWIWGGEKVGAQPSVATGAANALTNGAENHLFGWNRFAERGHKLALMPPAVILGRAHAVVEIRFGTGHISYFYVDPASGLAVRRRDERAYHPDVSATRQRVETRFTEFVAVDGVTAAHLNIDIDLATGKLLSTNRVLARRINPALPSDHFDRDRRAPATL